MKEKSSLRSLVRRQLSLAAAPRRPGIFRPLLVFLVLGSGVGGSAEAHGPYRQELIPASSFDVGEVANPDFADLDGDGDLDLVAGDYLGGIHLFENVRGSGSPAFRESPGSADPFRFIPLVGVASPELGDLDGDGDPDLVIGGEDGLIRYFRNTGTSSSPAFLELTGTANPWNGFDLGDNSSPVLADLDGDGDLDAVAGQKAGGLIYFANTGSASAPAFLPRTGASNPFAGIDVGSSSAPELVDLDADGDLDAVVGDLLGRVAYFANSGSSSAPAFVAMTGGANPFAALAGQPGYFYSNPVLADLDGDGDRDLALGEADGAIHYYLNTGGPSAATFVAASSFANPFLGAALDEQFCGAAVADLDGDGDCDLLAGGSSGELRYFRNTGAADRPAFAELTGSANPFSGQFVGIYQSPDLADLDGDGDYDAVIGNYDGGLEYLENTGGSAAPSFLKASAGANPFGSIGVRFGVTTPELADLDGDGDLDLAVGNYALHFFVNTGSATSPAFVAATGSANPFAAIGFPFAGSPAFFDFDGDADLDLATGDQSGKFRFFVNVGDGENPAFTEATDLLNIFRGIDLGSNSSAEWLDLDRDRDADLLATENGGRLVFIAATAAGVWGDGFESGDLRNWSASLP